VEETPIKTEGMKLAKPTPVLFANLKKKKMMKYQKSEPETIQKMFGSIAKSYDRVNGIMSFQLHRIWNRRLIKTLLKENKSFCSLDLCSGTGEIAFTHLKLNPQCHTIYLLDFCHEMLEVAKEKAHPFSSKDIHYLTADAQAIPLNDQCVETVSMAYGIRNVKDPKKCFNEVFRVLKDEGAFALLELTEPKNPLLKFLHGLYLKMALPLFGEAYSYLGKSIQNFVPPSHLAALLKECGFCTIKKISLCGGIATIIIAKKKPLQS
jgi:demethylmenaquinone methyltransferase/2-methoxy-6-polyprenyl-1,4-benzoquinol methylase